MTKEEFERLEVGETIRRLGVTYRVRRIYGSGIRRLYAYKQVLPYDVYVKPTNLTFIQQCHPWPDITA